MKTGLVSVTFRQMTPEEIITLCSGTGITGIEWGSDVHCPIGDLENAQKIAKLMHENSLETISYGSYYKIGESDKADFDDILKTAVALSAPNIRVWAGDKNSEDADQSYRLNAVNDAKRIAKLAQEYSISISFEYHGNTLTNTQQSTLKLLEEVDCPNVYTYWQPLFNTNYEDNINNIKELISLKKLKNIHAYKWENGEKLPLSAAKSEWKSYLELAQKSCNAVLLEFVKDDSAEQFLQDLTVLKALV